MPERLGEPKGISELCFLLDIDGLTNLPIKGKMNKQCSTNPETGIIPLGSVKLVLNRETLVLFTDVSPY